LAGQKGEQSRKGQEKSTRSEKNRLESSYNLGMLDEKFYPVDRAFEHFPYVVKVPPFHRFIFGIPTIDARE